MRSTNSFDEAAKAYAVAISDDPTRLTVDRTLVQMKINDLPEPGEVAAVDESLQAPADEASGDMHSSAGSAAAAASTDAAAASRSSWR